MLEITEFTEARLASVTNRTEKHGDEDVPAGRLAAETTTNATQIKPFRLMSRDESIDGSGK